MKPFLFTLVFLYSSLFTFSQVTFGNDENINYYTFGVRIIPNGASIGQFFIIYAPNNTIQNTSPISKDEFIRFSLGMDVSKPNPDKENLFRKNGIQDWRTIEQIWKVRYAKYPYGSRILDTTILASDSLGWTNNFINPFMPTSEQMDILNQYGLQSINGYVYGNNLFRLLKDMEDSAWISRYKQAQPNN